MVSFLHTLLSFPLLLLFLFMIYKTIVKNSSTLPKGPKGLPIIGNLHQLDTSNIHFQFWNLSKIYGPFFSLQIGLKQSIVISTPKLAQQILKDHDLDVCSRPLSYGSQIISYNGLDMLFSPYNNCWKEIRKICVFHFFRSKKVSTFSHVRKYEVKEMMKKIYDNVSISKISNLSEIIMLVSSSIVCRIAFGKSCEHEGSEKSRFHGLLVEAQAISLPFFVSDYIPFMGWIDKLKGSVSRVNNTFKDLDVFFEEVLKEHLNPNNMKKEEEKDIVDVLLELKKLGSFSIDLTNDHIKAVLMNLFVAAIDTSAATSIWVMTGLMKNPRVMKKAQEEVRNLCGKKEFVDKDDIEKLVYLKAVIKETLRFYAPVPLIPRETNKSFNVNGYKIEPKTLVYVNIWAIHRDPETWKDPEKFYPKRIIEGLPGLVRHKKNHLCFIAKNHI
ncbi:6,7,8-trihydroxycoumarin synthase-like [Cicer arietinum]|uniref:Cytochrome P450 83B1-like n=1 Tax=Cicer arietinum TaxID=3827 RepID=A0A3Q7X3I9_CICAR|nr:cytochrome P450 83B1-like [Cicer arietinum]